MLLLHDKDQQWNNPLASLATCPCSQSPSQPKIFLGEIWWGQKCL